MVGSGATHHGAAATHPLMGNALRVGRGRSIANLGQRWGGRQEGKAAPSPHADRHSAGVSPSMFRPLDREAMTPAMVRHPHTSHSPQAQITRPFCHVW